MSDTFTFTLKPIVDLSDAKANVNSLQQAFSKLKLPNKITGKLESEIANFNKAYENAQKKMSEGIKTSGDFTQLQKSNNMMVSSWSNIAKIVKEVSNMDLSNVLRFDTEEIVKAQKELGELEKQLESINLSKTQTANIQKAIENVQAQTKSGKVKDLTSNMLSGLSEGNFRKVFDNYIELKKHHSEFINMFGAKTTNAINELGTTLERNTNVSGDITQKIVQTRQEVDNLKAAEESESKVNIGNKAEEIEQTARALRDVTDSTEDATKAQLDYNKSISKIESQIESYFGLNAIFRKVANMAREAMNTVKELDKAMTETAVVTNFSVGDMWEKLPIYTAEANKLGSTIKDVYEATTLYYQQGLNTTQSMGLAVETLKMARIAGMDAKDATDAMTAALRGFNLEINQASAQRINDVYSQLAANTASNTQEISTAMEKVASLAHNAGMELETTAAFLAQMIETTREAPENLGTALKTVVARFQEMKQDPTKLVDSEGVMLDANKVDKALKSIGVQLMDTNGQFRKLDDVFLEIASKWDTLTMGQQRYIATMAAGSRQQSRFIAMMSNYSRTIELVDMAYDASGASQRQFEKTLESMDSKLNKLKNAYDQFIMGLMNNQFLKTMVDFGTEALGTINNIIDTISSWTGPLKGTTKMLLTLLSTFGGLTAARGLLKGGIGLGVQWFSGKEARKEFEQKYFHKPDITQFKQWGAEAGVSFSTAFKQAQAKNLNDLQLKQYGKNIAPQLFGDIQTAFGKDMALQYEQLYKEAINSGIKPQEALKDIADQANMDAAATGNHDINFNLKQYEKGLEGIRGKAISAGSAVMSFGSTLQTLGGLLQGTPFAAFGKGLSLIGTLLTTVGSTIVTVATTGKIAVEEFGITLHAAIPELLLIVAAIGAVVAIGVALYREFTRDKREMEALAEAAKASSDAFDNLKTATEELKNSIEDIRNADSLFDGLVVGTTEWNLALVEANQQILDLIKKYPMLEKYMTTDTNGRMHISEAGFKAVQDEQQKLLSQAQALDIYNNAMHNAALTEQEKDKLLKSENIRKTKSQTIKHGQDSYTITEAQADEINYNALSDAGKREWESIEARLKAEQEAATKQAMRAALATSGELNDTVINLFSQNFEEAQNAIATSGVDINTMKQAYADFIGGTFDSATKIITDLGGEEVPVDDDAIKKMYPQIMAILQLQEEAPQVEAALKSLGKAFDSAFDGNGKGFLDDLLNNNLEIDASDLEISDDEIVDAVNELSEEQIHAIMRRNDAEANDLVKLLTDNRDKLKAAQASTYADAAVWYAKSKGMNARTSGLDAVAKRYANTITQGLTVGSADAVNKFMNQISQSFDSATTMAMGNNLFSALLGKASDVQQSITELINQVDWTSAIGRGQFYKLYEEGSDAFNKLTNDQKQFIKGQKKIDKELNLTGKQFEELVQSSDFLEILTEKWSDFTNETGKLDASGVEAMAKECSTLNKLLETGEFDAYQLATALNYFQDSGSFDGMTSAVLEAIKSFNSLDKLIGQVKKDVDEFQPGESYEQGMDAYRDYMDSLTKAYEHRKYSSADTLSYAQRFIGEDEWKTFVSEHGQSNKSAEKAIIDSLKTIFTDNEEDTTINILKRLANGKTLLGGEAEASKIFSAYYDELGNLKLKIDPKATRDDFINALVKERGFTEEMARSFLLSLEGQDWGFLEDNLTKGFDLAGREGGIKAYIEGIQDRGQIPTDTLTGNIVFTEAELEALKSMGGYESIDEVIADLANQLGIAAENIQLFNTETEGAAEYLAKLNGTTNTTKEQTREQAVDFLGANKGVVDFTAVTQKLEQTGISATKALDMAIDMAHEAGVEQVKWGDKLVDVSDIINGDQFNDAVDKLEDDANWTNVGNIIANAIVDALAEAGIGNGRKTENNDTSITDTVTNEILPSIKQPIELIVNKEQAEKNLAFVEDKISNLNEEIIQKKTLGLDTSNLEEQLKQAELEAERYRTKIKDINDQLDRLNNRTINVHYAATGNIKPGGLTQESQAKGKNNHISPSGFYAGSSARGRYGTIGPNNHGGLTLTGEKGFEIAWLPSENRSMILGAHGPQMVDLPSNATVWNHEQSKKIVKQKGIPMGSMTTGTYDTGSSGGSGSGSGSSSSSSKSSSKDKDPKHSNWYKEEVLRFNLNQKINKITLQIEKSAKEVSDRLKAIGTKYSDIVKDVDKQTKLLHDTIAAQEALRDSYRRELELLASGARQLYVSLTNASNESQEILINPSQFMSGNAETGYSISYTAIESYLQANGYGGDNLIANAEALFNLLNQQISNLQSGFDNAAKAIEEAQQKLKDLVKQVKEAFYAWENELTKVYDLTKQLEMNESRNSRLTTQISSLLSMVNSGFATIADTMDRLVAVQQQDIKLIKERLLLLKEQITAKQEELKALMDGGKAEKEYYESIKAANEATLKQGKALTAQDLARESAAYDAYARAAWGQLYLNTTLYEDGSYTLDFDEAQLEADRKAGLISEETYNLIKEGFDNIQENGVDYNSMIQEAQEYLIDLRDQLKDHYQTMASLENDLINAYVELATAEVKKLEALNSSLTAAAKAVIDQVKKDIDARRKAEDNAKTEADIAKKQQRLNALRANTNGGNQVEIAQLEKEIAEAQQSYGRTLEDQMLAQMQTQADEAAKQRQEQIDLAKQQIEYNRQAGVYAAQADELLDDIENQEAAIHDLLGSTADLGTGKWQQLVDELNLNEQIMNAIAANNMIPLLQETIETEGAELEALIEQLNATMQNVQTTIAAGNATNGPETYNATNGGIPTTGTSTGGSSGGGSTGGSSGGTTNTSPSGHGKLKGLPEKHQNTFSVAQKKALQEGLNDLQKDKLISFDNGKKLEIDGIIGPKTTAAIKALQKAVNTTQDGIWGPITGAATHKKFPKYKRGGLADFTGPAWLDGTQAKPELILNAQDTKNFIILKDILADAIRGINHIDRSETYNNPTEFNINVNVEKITSDYDVDRLTERIKRNIVKDATYRNVTQVRNFR